MSETQYQEQTSAPIHHHDDEITLKELILKIVEFAKEVLRRWWMIPLCCLLTAFIFFQEYYGHIPQYGARLTFMLDEDAGGGGSGINGLTDLLGGLGGNKGGGLEKIVQLFKSRRVIDNAVLKPVEINGKMDILANHFLSIYPTRDLVDDFNGNWVGNIKDIDNFRFVNTETDKMIEQERMVLQVIYHTIVGHPDVTNIPPVIRTNLDEDSGIMTLTTVSVSEDLTLTLGDAIYENLASFFVNKATEKQQKLHDIIQFKKDSVGTALALAEYKLADFEDKSRNMVTYKGFLEKMKLQREKTILTVMYSAVVKNMETADFALRSKTPYVQVIDVPFRPLSPSSVSLTTTLIKTIFSGAFIAIFLVVLRKIIVDALAT